MVIPADHGNLGKMEPAHGRHAQPAQLTGMPVAPSKLEDVGCRFGLV